MLKKILILIVMASMPFVAFSQAIEEVNKLEEQIQLAFELPPMYYKG